MDIPLTLARDISPPAKRRKSSQIASSSSKAHDETISPPLDSSNALPTLAAVEAGKAKIEDHLAYFKQHLAKASRPTDDDIPRISIKEWADLYRRNEHEHGNHFVVHQHNHPVSGVHYDLRLQFSATSSISFAIPKGLPGNPNSLSPGRMAIETRVHNLWNHLIESASPKTGSLLIWDTGTYAVLPRKSPSGRMPSPMTTDDEGTDEEEEGKARAMNGLRRSGDGQQENEKLIAAFQSRHIRLRLNGTRLPKNYTVTLRLPSNNFLSKSHAGPARKKTRRTPAKPQPEPHSTDSEPDAHPTLRKSALRQEDFQEDLTSDDEEEDVQTRLHNAYPGSTNTIGSIHQRQWFMLLDRTSSGFVLEKGTGRWKRDEHGGFEPFFVRGREYERSVVTGRLAGEVESDEGVEGFVGRSGWVGIDR